MSKRTVHCDLTLHYNEHSEHKRESYTLSLPHLESEMVLLTELPPEIVHHVLGYVDPPDLAWIPRICKSFYYTIKGNASLFKDVYLNHFDQPSTKSSVDWEKGLKDIVRLQVICDDRKNIQNKVRELV